MIAVNADFMLDAVCLAAFSKSDDVKETLRSILEIYTDAKKKTPDILDPDLEVFFDIIHDVTEREADLSTDTAAECIAAAPRYSPHPPPRSGSSPHTARSGHPRPPAPRGCSR